MLVYIGVYLLIGIMVCVLGGAVLGSLIKDDGFYAVLCLFLWPIFAGIVLIMSIEKFALFLVKLGSKLNK